MKQFASNEDCMEYMARLEDNAFHLAILDPQYGIDEMHRAASNRRLNVKQANGGVLKINRNTYDYKEWDKERPSKEYFDEIQRISRHQIIFGGNHFADLLPPSTGWIVWDKVNGNNKFSDAELAWTSFPIRTRMVRYMWNGMMQGRSIAQGTVQQGNKKLNEERIHPNQKPVRLYEWILREYAEPGWNIFDSHLGSGSSRIAAYNLGFEFVGTELDPDYFKEQEERFNKHVALQEQAITLF